GAAWTEVTHVAKASNAVARIGSVDGRRRGMCERAPQGVRDLVWNGKSAGWRRLLPAYPLAAKSGASDSGDSTPRFRREFRAKLKRRRWARRPSAGKAPRVPSWPTRGALPVVGPPLGPGRRFKFFWAAKS